MKKNLLCYIGILLTAMIISGCGKKSVGEKREEKVYFEAIILEVNDNSILVEPKEGTNERLSADQISVSTKDLNSEELYRMESGVTVGISYDGNILESYPAQLNEVYEIKIINETGQESIVTSTEEMTPENETIEEKVSQNGNGQNFVGIQAHVKEIDDQSILISSESDDFPGAFYVEVTKDIYDIASLSGGDTILIQMQDLNEENKQGLKKFLAKSIVIASMDDENAKEDTLLTAAPSVYLSDALSSTLNSFKINAGNYSWNYIKGSKTICVNACGAHPLDKNYIDHMEALNIPEYNKLDFAPYSFICSILPDRLTIHEWNINDIGNMDAEVISTMIFYYNPHFLELKPDRVYELVADWDKSNLEINGFYGNASYVMVTQ